MSFELPLVVEVESETEDELRNRLAEVNTQIEVEVWDAAFDHADIPVADEARDRLSHPVLRPLSPRTPAPIGRPGEERAGGFWTGEPGARPPGESIAQGGDVQRHYSGSQNKGL